MTVAPRRTGILFAAAGTSCPEARRTLEGIGHAATLRFPGIEHRWTYTSAGVRRKLLEQGGSVNAPEQALMAMQEEGFTDVAVVSLHLSGGVEYAELAAMVTTFTARGGELKKLALGPTLLSDEKSFRRVLDVLLTGLPSKLGPHEVAVLVAHGSQDSRVAGTLKSAALTCRQVDRRLMMGMMLGEPSMAEVVKECVAASVTKVWLVPLMVAAGYSAREDIAGLGEQSWKTAFKQAGLSCIPVLKGLGEYPEIVDVWMDQTKELLGTLVG